MNENNQLKAFVAFLFIFSVMMLSQAATAAVAVVPSVPGYSASAGTFSSASGTFTMTAANDGFIKPAITSVGGRSVTIPATLRMASNAGQIAKNAMRLNPWALAGTLALGYLADNLISPDGQGGFVIEDTSGGTYPGGQLWRNNSAQGYTTGTAQGPYANQCGVTSGGCSIELAAKFVVLVNVAPYGYPGTVQKIACTEAGWCQFSVQRGAPFNDTHTDNYQLVGTGTPAPSTSRPMTPEDWDALPDPLPAIAPELPYAPYMPEGVPVDVPEYSPSTITIGEPYTRPDGSTVQPMATVSPGAPGEVVLDTYDQPLTDPQGQPVQNPVPQDTQEPAPSECQLHPETIGCAQFGTPPAPDSLTTLQVPVSPTVTPVGGAGSCPADITTSIYGLTWSYQPICDFASAIRPLIIGFAWLAFAYIVAGTVRT